MALMGEIVSAGELAHLSTERIWVETQKALTEQDPQIYWQVLGKCSALAALMPELQVSQGIDALARSAPFTGRVDARWAALLADLPEARAHDASARMKAPKAFALLASRVSAGRPKLKAALRNAEECMALLRALDALRRDEPFNGFCETLIALEQHSADAQAAIALLVSARQAAREVSAAAFAEEGIEGRALGAAIEAGQIEQIARLLS
jgi:tRNA nucleotidyltransferase (CCA-adding enzyme)